jgi:DNA-binding beta-propeller fold protein YncE
MMNRRTFLSLLAASATRAADPPEDAILFVGALQKQILVIDEAQGKVVDRIQTRTGVPRRMRLSYDRKKIYVWTPEKDGIEVVDMAARKVMASFVLNQANRRESFNGFAPDPQDHLLYGTCSTAIKQMDRFEIEKPKFAIVDLAQQKIIKTAEAPMVDGRPSVGGNYRVSPDGKFLYVFSENVRIYDTTDLKLLDTIELSKPLYPGMATIGFFFRDDPSESPGTVTGIFNSTDPVVRRSIFGIAKFDLNKRSFDFTPVGPSASGVGGLQLSPDKKTGYTMAYHGDVGNRRAEFWVFDMTTRKVVKRVEYEGPPQNFTLSGNGKQIYLTSSAPIIEVYDANTLQSKAAIEIGADMTSGPLVVPRHLV